jgi:hypothetical protein
LAFSQLEPTDFSGDDALNFVANAHEQRAVAIDVLGAAANDTRYGVPLDASA